MGFALLTGTTGEGDTSWEYVLEHPHCTLGKRKDAQVQTLRKRTDTDVHLGNCTKIARLHVRIDYDFIARQWLCHVLGKTGATIDDAFYADGTHVLRAGALIGIPCGTEGHAHEFWFRLPSEASNIESGNLKQLLSKDYTPFSKSEREQYVRGVLTFGHRRPTMIKQIGPLTRRSVEEIHEFTISFYKCMLENLMPEEVHERTYLMRVLEKEDTGSLCDLDLGEDVRPKEPSLLDWKKITKSSGSWVRRLRNLQFLDEMIHLHREFGIDILMGMSETSLSDRRPTKTWTDEDDREMLQGIYKHGYGRFDLIKEDTSFRFSMGKHEDQWPTSEKLNKRIKKILDSGREAYLNSRESYNAVLQRVDPSALQGASEDAAPIPAEYNEEHVVPSTAPSYTWSTAERNDFVNALMSFGLRRTFDGELDWSFLRRVSGLEDKPNVALERMYVRLVREIEYYDTRGSKSTVPGSIKSMFLKPQVASKLKHRLEISREIQDLLLDHPEECDEAIKSTAPALTAGLPSWWKAGDHDLHMVYSCCRNGIGAWEQLIEDKTLSDISDIQRVGSCEDIPKSEVMFRRLRVVMNAVKKAPIHKPIDKWQGACKVRAVFPHVVYRSRADNAVKLPMVVDYGFVLKSLGDTSAICDVDGLRCPLGYETVRLYQSIYRPNAYMEYSCSIRIDETAEDPVTFAVAPILGAEMNPEEAVLFEDTTPDGVWKLVDARIESLTGKYRKTVEHEGIQRFGLTHPVVQHLLGEKRDDIKTVVVE